MEESRDQGPQQRAEIDPTRTKCTREYDTYYMYLRLLYCLVEVRYGRKMVIFPPNSTEIVKIRPFYIELT